MIFPWSKYMTAKLSENLCGFDVVAKKTDFDVTTAFN